MERLPIRVLLVEDDPVAAVLFEAQLASATGPGFEVSLAGTLAEAEERLSEVAPEVIALDLTLPDSSGLETLDRVRRVARDTPVVVLTGLDEEGLAEKVRRRGASGLLIKGRAGNRVNEVLLQALADPS